MKTREELLKLRERVVNEFAQIAIGYGNNDIITKELMASTTSTSLAIIATIDFCLDDTGKSIETVTQETDKYLVELIHIDGEIKAESDDKSPVLSELKQFKK